MSNYEVLDKNTDKYKPFICSIRKIQMKFLGYPMRKEGLGNLIVRRHLENKRDGVKQDIAYLTSLGKWMGEQVRRYSKTTNFTKVYK